MNEYKVVYNRVCYYWAVLCKGREVFTATTKAEAEKWASSH